MAFAVRQSTKLLVANQILRVNSRNIKMSAQLRAEEAMEKLKKKNPYFEKYAGKISALQQTSPEEFLERLDSVEKTKQPKITEETKRWFF